MELLAADGEVVTETRLETVEACDLCGARTFRPRKVWKDLLLFGPETWRLVECEACRLHFITPRPTRDEIAKFYPTDYPAHCAPATEPKPWHRAVSSKDAPEPGLYGRMRNHFRQDISWYRFPAWRGEGRVLDIGCGSGGRYLDVLKGLGWTTYGVEPSPHAVAHANAKGHRAVVGSAEEQQFDDASMDVVTMWHVLEHTHSPRKALESCFRMLRPGGQLSLCVPNWNSSQRALFGRYWWSCDAPRHLFQFTKQTVTRYLETTGFRIRSIRTRTGATSWQRAFRGMFNDAFGNRWRNDSRVLVTLSDGLVAMLSAVRFFGMGSELRVVAERPE